MTQETPPSVRPSIRRTSPEPAGDEGPVFQLSVACTGPSSCVIRLDGELDLATTDQLQAMLDRMWDTGHRHAQLDMSAVSFLDCAALGVLVAAHQRFRAARGALLLTGVGTRIAHVLRLTGLDTMLLTTQTR